MESFKEKIMIFARDNDVQGECLHFETSCHSAQEAADVAGADILDIVKNICYITENDDVVTAIVQGQEKVDKDKIKALLGGGDIRMATKDEVLLKTGYPTGGVPSFGYPALFLVDTKVLERQYVYTGGGDEYSLFKITPANLVRANNGRVVDIRK